MRKLSLRTYSLEDPNYYVLISNRVKIEPKNSLTPEPFFLATYTLPESILFPAEIS